MRGFTRRVDGLRLLRGTGRHEAGGVWRRRGAGAGRVRSYGGDSRLLYVLVVVAECCYECCQCPQLLTNRVRTEKGVTT